MICELSSFSIGNLCKALDHRPGHPFPEESIVVKEQKTSRETKKAPAKSMKEKRAAKAAKKSK